MINESGVPSGPTLTVSWADGNLTLAWDRDGFQLESTSDLGGTWTPVLTVGMQHTVPATGPRQFYRLKQ
jgi:hypothetical protein